MRHCYIEFTFVIALELRKRLMTRAEVLDLIRAGGATTALPRRVDSKRIIVAVQSSRCCHAPSLLVLSRPGGFIAQDCLQCGRRSDYVREADIPDLDCEGCPRPRTIEPAIIDRNYWYVCTGCRREWKIAEIVPIWSEMFEYSGLAAPGDIGFRR